jgi:hypothetical protein
MYSNTVQLLYSTKLYGPYGGGQLMPITYIYSLYTLQYIKYCGGRILYVIIFIDVVCFANYNVCPYAGNIFTIKIKFYICTF